MKFLGMSCKCQVCKASDSAKATVAVTPAPAQKTGKAETDDNVLAKEYRDKQEEVLREIAETPNSGGAASSNSPLVVHSECSHLQFFFLQPGMPHFFWKLKHFPFFLGWPSFPLPLPLSVSAAAATVEEP